MMNEGPPPPQNSSYRPQYNAASPRRGGRRLRCICCFYCTLFLIVLIITSILIYFYVFFKPVAPSYKMLDLTVTSYNTTPATLGVGYNIKSDVEVTVEATNPNNHISLEYMKNSSVTVKYVGVLISSGSLPSFHQGHNNVTIFKVYMTGNSTLDTKTQHSLMADDSKARIPLDIDVMVPVQVILGHGFKLKEFSVNLKCQLEVDHLTPGKKTQILSSSYSYNVEF